MVGRDSELALLSDLWARVTQESRPHLVTVIGEPGIGKSRLVSEFEQRLSSATAIHGRCGDGSLRSRSGLWALGSGL